MSVFNTNIHRFSFKKNQTNNTQNLKEIYDKLYKSNKNINQKLLKELLINLRNLHYNSWLSYNNEVFTHFRQRYMKQLLKEYNINNIKHKGNIKCCKILKYDYLTQTLGKDININNIKQIINKNISEKTTNFTIIFNDRELLYTGNLKNSIQRITKSDLTLMHFEEVINIIDNFNSVASGIIADANGTDEYYSLWKGTKIGNIKGLTGTKFTSLNKYMNKEIIDKEGNIIASCEPAIKTLLDILIYHILKYGLKSIKISKKDGNIKINKTTAMNRMNEIKKEIIGIAHKYYQIMGGKKGTLFYQKMKINIPLENYGNVPTVEKKENIKNKQKNDIILRMIRKRKNPRKQKKAPKKILHSTGGWSKMQLKSRNKKTLKKWKYKRLDQINKSDRKLRHQTKQT